MKFNPRSKKTLIITAVIVILAVIALKLVGIGSTGSATKVGYIGNAGRSSWSGRYTSLNGTMKKNLHPKSDTLHISVETESGTLTVEVRDADGNLLLDQTCASADDFDVAVSGKVSIQLHADHHKGSFSIE